LSDILPVNCNFIRGYPESDKTQTWLYPKFGFKCNKERS